MAQPRRQGQPVGRRERKKAATRQALADAALRLFLRQGFDQVGVKEVAEAAGVSVTTLFKYFSSKEALVFDREDAREAAMVAAVRERGADQSVVDALHEIMCGHVSALPSSPALRRFHALVEGTPALAEYSHRMWMRHEQALVHAISSETGADRDDVAVRALVRCALESRRLARLDEDPLAALDRIFAFLRGGWGAPEFVGQSPRPGALGPPCPARRPDRTDPPGRSATHEVP